MGNHSDDEFSVAGDKPEVEFMDFQNDNTLQDYQSDDGPVVVTAPFPFTNGKPKSVLVGETSADTISIENTSSEPVNLWSVRIFSSNPEDSYVLSMMKPPSNDADEETKKAFLGLTSVEDRTLQPGQTLTIWLSCMPKEIGLHTSIVHVDIGDEKIERVAFLLADDNVSMALFSDKPYSRGRGTPRKKFECATFVPGSRPIRQHTQGFKYKLPQFAIPVEVRELIECKQRPDVLSEELSMINYAKFFSTLLVMEEIHLEEEMRTYDMECVSMRRRGNDFLSLEVLGLAEKRPSLVHGDYIVARHARSNDRPYQGFIHKVEADEIFLRFDNSFHIAHHDRNKYDVSFTYNRLNMRRLYRSVHDAELIGPDILFPSLSRYRSIKKVPFKPLNPDINTEQADAVGMILGCRGVPPYVIYGPPGTGKTMTLVEAILQLYTSNRRANILICAASNSAADHVLAKLLSASYLIRPSDIFRLNAPSRQYEDVNPDFIRFCFFEDMVFKCPPMRALMRYKIVISTYMSSSTLQAEGIRPGHFTHIFLDEAGQSSEPEAMVPLGLCGRDTVVVLAGDPMQLGPVVFSKQADKDGLGTSYLQRLLCDFEQYHSEDPNYVTKLLRNYRCHPAILELPSQLFYGSELIACKGDEVPSVYDCIGLPNKSFPVLFVGIQGCDEREGNNPSWFNRIEASKVVNIIRTLTRDGDVCEADIGVITPYRQQVVKIKRALETFEMPDLRVGSVEQFQGQEREIIIMSTVRSTVKHNEIDKVFNLGFLTNYRRFNVAITRARSLLIIVGNPHIITKDRYWDKLLRYCADNDSYQGCPLPPPEEELRYSGYSDTRNQSAAGWEYNQEPSDRGFRHDKAPSSTEKVLEWSDERPDEDYHSPPTEGAESQEGAQHQQQQQHVEEEAGQDDVQPGQNSAVDDGAVDDAYVQKYTFPPGWCDVSNIPATGWD